MNLIDRLFGRGKLLAEMNQLRQTSNDLQSEVERLKKTKGRVATPENSIRYLYNRMHVDPDQRQSVLDIRLMDKLDGRVKKIHRRMARDVVKSGLRLVWKDKENARIIRAWKAFERRLQLHNPDKLKSDARGCVMEGNLILQWVFNQNRIVGAVRMPSETIVPQVDINGCFENMQQAYIQYDPLTWEKLASFPFWQLAVVRLDPDNFDDMGAMGRPYLDANRTVWQKLTMTEEDLVIRRRHRAPQKLSHNLEGATKEELDTYKQQVELQSGEIQTDFFSNKKGSVTAIEGDANLDQIADVSYLLDTFFSGGPAPKGLFGYVGDLNRDVLEDLKKDYYEEIDGVQDVQAFAYEQGFRLELLLNRINPDAYDFQIAFAERKTETRNQRADYALKLQAMGVPNNLVYESAGLDVTRVKNLQAEEGDKNNPYPTTKQPRIKEKPDLSVTPGNAPKGESATTISTRSGNS